jgi:hypothetical protein
MSVGCRIAREDRGKRTRSKDSALHALKRTNREQKSNKNHVAEKEPASSYRIMEFGEWNLGEHTMSSGKEKEFESYARECVKLAEQADTLELRESLLTMAREWMQALMEEEDSGLATGE